MTSIPSSVWEERIFERLVVVGKSLQFLRGMVWKPEGG
jgi:hypothetical protein